MTPEQIRLVQESFRRIAPQGEAFARTFYERLFALDPALEPPFAGDTRQQRRGLMAGLALMVEALGDPETIVPLLQALGWRQAACGVRPEHVATIGDALLAALKESLGPAFGNELRAAWTACYVMVEVITLQAMRQAKPNAVAVAVRAA